jgi:hypothetical protein
MIDPIVEEVHAVRRKIWEECGCDSQNYFEYILEFQRQHPENLVSYVPRSRSSPEAAKNVEGLPVPRISYFFGVIVAMYFNDHNPPHFHAEYGDNEAEFSIDTLECLRGHLPRRARAMVVEWASLHRLELAENWDRVREGLPLLPIDPLD